MCYKINHNCVECTVADVIRITHGKQGSFSELKTYMKQTFRTVPLYTT